MHRPVRTLLLALVFTVELSCVGYLPPAPRPISSGRAFQAKFAPLETASTSLPGGVRIFLERDPQSPVVSIGWMVPAGRASDPPGKSGLAHLTEHLVFEAPRQDGLNEIQFFDRSGVEFRGETDSAATRYGGSRCPICSGGSKPTSDRRTRWSLP
jgi:hypothetical protein